METSDLGRVIGELSGSSDILRRLDRGEPVTLVLKKDRGSIEVREIDPDQAWFWSPEHQAREAEADAEYQSGAGVRYGDDDFLAHLESATHSD